MKIALDYDETFTEDPILWEGFIKLAKERKHVVTFVTYRLDSIDNEDIISDSKRLGIELVFTNGKQKSSCSSADIWIDDNPVTIPSTASLLLMHRGCIQSGEG